jgi:hypothetical protein
MLANTWKIKRWETIDWILVLVSIALFTLSCYYAQERIIFTDTAVYFFVITDTSNVYTSSRFICILSQWMPMLGALLGLPLKVLLYLYSINFILIPLLSMLCCAKVFRNKSMALAIGLFYTIMNSLVFYYPVTEFQMGLCLLLVYHAFLLWYFDSMPKASPILFIVVTLALGSTILWAHPLVQLVFGAYLCWVFCTMPQFRNRLMLAPVLLWLSYIVYKKWGIPLHGFQANYDKQQMQNLDNFKVPFAEYFNFNLASTFYHKFLADYFVVIAIILLSVFFLLRQRKWLSAILFLGILFSFWLLVIVCYKDYDYNYYTEHMMQPVPFFIALVWASNYKKWLGNWPIIAPISIALFFIISISKINNAQSEFAKRLQWYKNYIGLMQRNGVENAVIQPSYRAFGNEYNYWASTCESNILSSLEHNNTTVNLKVDWDAGKYNDNLSTERKEQTRYYRFSNTPFVMLDSIATPKILEQLKQVY